MARRPVAVATAVVLVLEAVGIGLLNWILGIMVDRQQMSLAGLDSHAMSVSTWVMGGVAGLYLVVCALVALRAGLRDRAPHGAARILLITCAVLHGLLGAFAIGLVGWLAFVLMMLVLALLVLTLMMYDGPATVGPTGPTEDAGPAPEAGPRLA